MNRTLYGVAAVAALAVALLVAACGGETRSSAAPPRPPLTYPVGTGPVPSWLENVRPLEHGRWVNSLPSPDEKTLLAQWLAECEIPIAYFVSQAMRTAKPVVAGHDRPVESVAVGWNADGRAGVFISEGACGAGDPRPGLYLVSLAGDREFVTAQIDEIERWQSARR